MLKVYGMSSSGNCYKIKLLLEQLARPYAWEEMDIMQGSTRTADFLAMNPNGKVPTLEIEPGVFLAESNAILHYIAEGTVFMPTNKLARAQVLQWLFFEQHSHEPYIAVAGFNAAQCLGRGGLRGGLGPGPEAHGYWAGGWPRATSGHWRSRHGLAIEKVTTLR